MSYVTVVQKDGKWVAVAMVYDSGSKVHHKVKVGEPTTKRNTAVTTGRQFAIDNEWQFIS